MGQNGISQRFAGKCLRQPRLAPLVFVVVGLGVALTTPSSAEVHTVIQTGGPPELPHPTFQETGLPDFTMPVGKSSFPETPSPSGGNSSGNGSGGGGSGDGAGSLAANAMANRSWGALAAQNADAVGVTPISVAATCTIEASNCSINPGALAGGTISGTFQMRDDVYQQMMKSALARDPNLVSTIVPGLAGKLDPATESIAAAEYSRQIATGLQTNGVNTPTVLDVRGGYNFGPANALGLSKADGGAVFSDVVPLSASSYHANGITPGVTTVDQWRQTIISKIGASAASAPVLKSAA